MEAREVLARLAESGTPPDSSSVLGLSVGLDATIGRLREETFPFIAAGGAELQFTFAPYGRGKTHYLRTIQEVARREGFATSYVDCRSDTAPFASLQDTFRAIAANLLPVGSVDGLSRHSGPTALIEEALAWLPPGAIEPWIHSLQRDPLLAIDFRNLVTACCRATLDPESCAELKVELSVLLQSGQTTGVRVIDLYRAHRWLPRPIGKLGPRNAAAWLRSLAALPRALGYPGLVILFDETERSHSFHRLSHAQRTRHLANLRNFVDHMAVGHYPACMIIYAVVEDFLETARAELGALSQRIERVQLGGSRRPSNPRAVWVALDELTVPSPDTSAFFEALGERIAQIAIDAGLPKARKESILASLELKRADFVQSINVGAVREFVKMAASLSAQELSHHD